MGLKQYKVGKAWEEDIMDYYSSKGYATIKLPTDLDGTVFDILAIKNNHCVCIEAKHTTTDKLYFKSCGLERKRDELDNFCSYGNQIIIFVKSDKTGIWCNTWDILRPIFKQKGYITKDDCVVINL